MVLHSHNIFASNFYLYDYLSNNGNYRRSKSLILTVFRKWFFYSFPVVGLLLTGDNLKYFYTIVLPLLEENFEKLSKLKKGHIFTKKPIIKNLDQLANKKALYKKATLFWIMASFELQTSNLPRPTPWLIFIPFLSYKFSKFPKTFSKLCLNILFLQIRKWSNLLYKCYFLKMKSFWLFSYFSKTDTFWKYSHVQPIIKP